MTNFEKIDDYLANRLPAEEKAEFEHALEGDPALKSEVALQEQIIKGIQKARAAELKHMLQQVNVPASGWSAGQVAAGVLLTGAIATGLYLYLRPEPPTALTPEVVTQPAPVAEPEVVKETPDAAKAVAEEPRKQPSSATKKQAVSPVQKPDIQVVDPTSELTESTPAGSDATTTPSRSEVTVSKLDVVTMAPDKKYVFHYQFMEGKLRLYGPFDRNLYEILEINGDSHAVFLFYKENYYLLDESQQAVTQLSPIRDGQLLRKLREYRSR